MFRIKFLYLFSFQISLITQEKHEDPKSAQETLQNLEKDVESYISIWENINLSNDTAYIFAKSEELKDKMLNVTLEQLILAKTFEESKLVPTFGSLYATKADHLDEEIDKFFDSLTNLKQLSPSGKFLST